MKPVIVSLVKPSAEFKTSFLEALLEFQNEKLPWMMDLDYVDIKQDFEKFLKQELSGFTLAGDDVPIPETRYWGIVENQFVGKISVRHQLNDALRVVGGHIGYDTRPSWRGRGVASEMLKQVLPLAKKLGLDEVLLTCSDDNTHSIRVIEKNGAQLKEKKLLYADGPIKRYYWIRL